MNGCNHGEWSPACPFCGEEMLALTDDQVAAICNATRHVNDPALAPIRERYDAISRYTVGMVNHGTAWGVLDASADELAEPVTEGWRMPLSEARRFAADNAKRDGTRWFDFSGDGAPSDTTEH